MSAAGLLSGLGDKNLLPFSPKAITAAIIIILFIRSQTILSTPFPLNER